MAGQAWGLLLGLGMEAGMEAHLRSDRKWRCCAATMPGTAATDSRKIRRKATLSGVGSAASYPVTLLKVQYATCPG